MSLICKCENLTCFDVVLRISIFVWQRNLTLAFEQQWNEVVRSFIHILSFREKFVLIEWCFFSSATYIRGFYYVVVNFLRGSGAEKNIFEKRYKIRFLMNRAVVENLSNVICVLSNDVGCDEGFFWMWGVCMIKRPSVFFIRLGRLLRASK